MGHVVGLCHVTLALETHLVFQRHVGEYKDIFFVIRNVHNNLTVSVGQDN